MKFGEIEFPDPLLSALRDGKLVVFAGAGVSMGEPACLPDFLGLALRIAKHTEKEPEPPLDEFLGRLQLNGVDVHERAARALSTRGACSPGSRRKKPEPTELHRGLLRLFGGPEDLLLVTTNFDVLFEQAADQVLDEPPSVFCAPALPLGNDFTGIVHLHGSLEMPRRMVLTDADFGRAYLTEGWARQFIVDLFQTHTVLFVGYGHRDVVLNYLARALPPSDRRYALVDETSAKSAHWDQLRVKRIAYAQRNPDDHRALTTGVLALADWMHRDVFERRREIRELAAAPPPLDEERSERLAFALEEVENVRFFVESAESPNWIEWLEERGYLNGLFDDNSSRETGHLFGRWLLRRFGVDDATTVFALFSRHTNSVAARFWFSVSWMLQDEEIDLNDETLAQWVTLLLDNAPRNKDVDTHLLMLGTRCAKQGRSWEVLRISESFLAPKLCSVQTAQIRNVVGAGGVAQHLFDRLWEQCIAPSLHEIATPLLESAIALLERRQHLLEVWRPEDGGRDLELIFRSAVEPQGGEFPSLRGFVDMALDVARDSLVWLAKHDEQTLKPWCDRMIRSNSTALRRLAVHGLSLGHGLRADERIDWLLDNTDLHDLSLRPEVFRVARESFPPAGNEVRRRFVDRIVRFEGRASTEEEAAKTAYQQFNWLVWLEDVAPRCSFVKEALDPIRESHPEFGRRDRPDLVVTPGEAYIVKRRSRWSAAQLLEQEPKEWVASLPVDLPEEELGPDGRSVDRAGGLADEIEKAVKTDPPWGLAVARALLGANRLEEAFWPSLLRSLGAAPAEMVEDVLSFFQQSDVQARYGREIAEAVDSALKDGKSPWTGDLFARILELGGALSAEARSGGTVGYRGGSWVDRAVSDSAWPLAMLWIRSLEVLRRKDRVVTGDSCYRRVRASLSRIVEDTTDFGAASAATLACHLRFLLAVEEKWTREKLLPLFDAETAESARGTLHEAVWDGFLSSLGRPEPAVPQAMIPVFLAAAADLGKFSEWKKEEIIRCASWMMIHNSADPLTEWVPPLFRNTEEEDRLRLAKAVEFHLLRASPEVQLRCWERWLSHYWLHRIEGVPAPLTAGETAAMFDWLTRLPAVLEEAVDVAVRMRVPDAELPRVGVWEVRDALPVPDYATPLAKLALRLDVFTLSPWDDYELDKLFADLVEAELPEETSLRLTEVAVRRGVIK